MEKGSEVGAHILSGNVFEPRALEELFPNYAEVRSRKRWCYMGRDGVS